MSVSVESQAMKLEEAINKTGEMKVLPSVARKVLGVVERGDVAGNQLAEVIWKEQARSAHLLKAANSALFELPREITTVLMAVNVLGFKTRDTTIVAATRGACLQAIRHYRRSALDPLLFGGNKRQENREPTCALRARRRFHLRSASRCGQRHPEQRVPQANCVTLSTWLIIQHGASRIFQRKPLPSW